MSKQGVESSIPSGKELEELIAASKDPRLLIDSIEGSGDDYNLASFNNHKAAGRAHHQNKAKYNAAAQGRKPKK